MNSQDSQSLATALRWASEDHRFTLITVARTWGSAPRPVSSWLMLRDDGLVQGSVSGGCIEDDLIARMAAGELSRKLPFVLRYGETKEEAERFGLPCGGVMELVVEPAPDVTALAAMAKRIHAGQLALRRMDLATGSSHIRDGSRDDRFQWEGKCLTTLHGPVWRLLIIGAGGISRYLAQMAVMLDYEVLICDPRDEYSATWDVPNTKFVAGMPDDAVIDLNLDPHSAVVALTHDPKLDDMALLEALKSAAFYVGALGSRANNAKRRKRLLQYFDLSETEVARLHGPVGLPIGSHMPPEIAVSILAEMTATKNGALAMAKVDSAQVMPGVNCRAE